LIRRTSAEEVKAVSVREATPAQDVAVVRPIRDEIERRVRTVLDELQVAAACHRSTALLLTRLLTRRCGTSARRRDEQDHGDGVQLSELQR
jgi:hypothetical protein